MTKYNETATKLLDAAILRTQQQGFNAFSYKDLQADVGVKTSSIHYYFPTKQDLALAMIEKYSKAFAEALNDIESTESSGLLRLSKLSEIYKNVVQQDKFCMCGMLASDMRSLPDAAGIKLQDFFDLNEKWIARAIALGKTQGDFKASIKEDDAAKLFLALLEGAILVTRTQKDNSFLNGAIDQAITQLKS